MDQTLLVHPFSAVAAVHWTLQCHLEAKPEAARLLLTFFCTRSTTTPCRAPCQLVYLAGQLDSFCLGDAITYCKFTVEFLVALFVPAKDFFASLGIVQM